MYTNAPNPNQVNKVETVLVLQGGGSLGAYECGVFKVLSEYGIKFDVVAGTSIGAVNAAIITSHKAGKDPVIELENFWMELSEKILPLFPPYSSIYFTDEMRAILATMYSAIYGHPRAFSRHTFTSPFNYFSFNLPYPLFDVSPLEHTLEKYVDYSTLSVKENLNHERTNRPRLIVTSTDIQTSEPVIFDSKNERIDSTSVLASVGFPFYGISWTEKNNHYLWDGALLSNTPLREVMDASPLMDKDVYLINIFPHFQKKLPNDIFEAWHRARDIIYNDKTDNNIKNSIINAEHLVLLKKMHDLLMKYDLELKSSSLKDSENSNKLSLELMNLEDNYHKIIERRGSIIKKITRIDRPEEHPFLFEDADFSELTIKKLIRQGEDDAKRAINSENLSSKN
ncbi:MAG TPA: patatin-like phospholipase family protein [Candidatus Nitrosocosmicus sp.]|nr:patatin-like phospholipase family protein [Candidatus Nitrosocosmicus sp.]